MSIRDIAILAIVWCGGACVGIAGTLFLVRKALKKEDLW